MDRNELILATTILLFGAFMLGFLSHWIVGRLSRVSKSELGELDRLAAALHDAEDERDRARDAQHQTEHRLSAKLAQTEAELSAAMDGLRAARQDADELRRYLSEQATSD